MGQVILFTSGKGGVGKTAVSALTGLALARLGKKVLLLEMDSGLRGLDIVLGLEKSIVFDISDVLKAKCEPAKAIYRSNVQKKLFLMPASNDQLFEPYGNDLIRLTKLLSKYFDYILIDSPAGFGKGFEVSLKVADAAIIVVTPDPICVRDAKVVSDIIFSNGISNTKLIINKVRKKIGKINPIQNLDEIIDITATRLLGVVADDDEIPMLMSSGKIFDSNTQLNYTFLSIASRILGAYKPLIIR
ncbi:MAG: AAA family ATPase [Oscillospiraceae bacterium]